MILTENPETIPKIARGHMYYKHRCDGSRQMKKFRQVKDEVGEIRTRGYNKVCINSVKSGPFSLSRVDEGRAVEIQFLRSPSQRTRKSGI